jgi:hypothetical protein
LIDLLGEFIIVFYISNLTPKATICVYLDFGIDIRKFRIIKLIFSKNIDEKLDKIGGDKLRI